MTDQIEHKIGFDTIREQIASLCSSAIGAARCTEMAFSTDFRQIKEELSRTAEMLGIINSGSAFPIGNIHDRRNLLQSLRVPGAFPAESELPGLRASLTAMADIASFFTKVREVNEETGRVNTPTLPSTLLRATFSRFRPLPRLSTE